MSDTIAVIRQKQTMLVRTVPQADWATQTVRELAAAAEESNQQAAEENLAAAGHATDAAASAAAALAQKNLILNADFDFSASGTLTITYNANGTINTISDGTTIKTCGYNAAGQLTTLT